MIYSILKNSLKQRKYALPYTLKFSTKSSGTYYSRINFAKLGISSTCLIAVGFGLTLYSNLSETVACECEQIIRPLVTPTWTPSTRATQLTELRKLSESNEQVDLLIIGGGATGAGCAVDGASRGLKVLCVEKDDFGSGTSSRSTKLVHGGVRYLEKAILELDIEQYKLVKEALFERGTFLKVAPHLAYELPILIPINNWYKIPYFYVGSKAYDLLAGSHGLKNSYFMGSQKAIEAFPMLDKSKIWGGMVYYDGAQNDTRMNITLILSAIQHGAIALNHTEVVDLVKTNGKITGAVVRDNLTKQVYNVKCKGVINATGPFTDAIRKMDDPATPDIVAPSAGVHIVLPDYYAPSNLGLINPSTSDGRVVFFLPWQGSTLVGTTDSPVKVSEHPIPSEEDIQWILNEVKGYLSSECDVRRSDVLSAWSGIRPLVMDPHAASTQALVRSHVVHVAKSGLLTIAGGKWTTYRAMAAETVDRAVKEFGLKPASECITDRLPLVGAENFHNSLYLQLVKDFGLATDVAHHLASSYGDRAIVIAQKCQASPSGRVGNSGRRLVENYPYLEDELKYVCQQEYACTAVDAIARRMRLAFLNAEATLECLPRVIDIMGSELNWSRARKQQEWREATKYLQGMGLSEPLLQKALKNPPPFCKSSITGPVGEFDQPFWSKFLGLVGHRQAPFEATPTQKLTSQYFAK